MILTETTTLAGANLPVQAFKDHLRLGSGFAEDSLQDPVLEIYLRAAIAAIEGRTGAVLIARSFLWSVTRWRGQGGNVRGESLPVRPVIALESIKRIDAQGVEEVLEVADFDLQDSLLIAIGESTGGVLPSIPDFGMVQIGLRAGYAPTDPRAEPTSSSWNNIPPDLYQAVLMLAAYFYENRSGEAQKTAFPPAVLALIERHRPLRLSPLRQGGV